MLLILSGCASSPRVSVPDWDIAERETQEITEQTELPALCAIPWTATECWAAVAEFEIVSEGNREIAQANAEALRAMEGAYDALIEAGKLQQQYAELREEMLQEERRDHLMDVWFYRGLLTIGGIAVIATQ